PDSSIEVDSTVGFDEEGILLIGDQRVRYGETDSTEFEDAEGGAGTFPSGTVVSQSGAGISIHVPGELELTNGALRMFSTVFFPPATPEVEDAALARMPYDYAQQLIGATGPVEGTAQVAACTWHGTILNPETGSFALVQRDGDLADLVGERISVSVFG